jgi:hypothetical protein
MILVRTAMPLGQPGQNGHVQARRADRKRPSAKLQEIDLRQPENQRRGRGGVRARTSLAAM